MRPEAVELAGRVGAGELRAGARLLRLVDDERPLAAEVLALLARRRRESSLIGVTGAPGAGKSTLVDQLIAAYRAGGHKVGVVAIDPSSPTSGGAVLADRLRMQRHTLDEGVFVRSLASRGQRGGLSASTSASARVLEAMGFDPVLVETVGTGQAELDVRALAHSVVLVLAPGMGDDVQAMKAGLLEIPDVFVVNKADREGADRVVRDLEAMLALDHDGARWLPPVLKTAAHTGEGVAQVLEALEGHRRHLQAGEAAQAQRRARARLELELALERSFRTWLFGQVGGEQALVAAAERIAGFESSAEEEVQRLLGAAR